MAVCTHVALLFVGAGAGCWEVAWVGVCVYLHVVPLIVGGGHAFIHGAICHFHLLPLLGCTLLSWWWCFCREGMPFLSWG